MRSSLFRTARNLAVISTALVLLSSCSVSEVLPGKGNDEHANEPPPVHYMAGTEVPVAVELLSLARMNEETVVARFRMTNVGNDYVWLTGIFSSWLEPLSGDPIWSQSDVAGATLVDTANLKRYYPLIAQDRRCVCSMFDKAGYNRENLYPNKSVEAYAVFPSPPADVQEVGVYFPYAPPWTNVPIEPDGGSVPKIKGQPMREPTKLQLMRPTILPLTSLVDDVKKRVTIREDDKQQEVNLSSDVLFHINKANLTPQAQGLLEDVAEDINSSEATVVRIDGHADSTGTDAINNPLSRRRAESVQHALEGMVDRDVRYIARGHGSSQPIASNATAAGRKKNRRVTVTFNK